MIADQLSGKEIHVILDIYSTHKKNDAWLAKFQGRVQFHFAPASASWLNQIEIYKDQLRDETCRTPLTTIDNRSTTSRRQHFLA